MPSAGVVNTAKTCGSRACPRRRRYIQHLYCLTHRFRWQASSHRTDAIRRCCEHRKNLWEPGLPAMASAHSASHCLTFRFRWQASSHKVFVDHQPCAHRRTGVSQPAGDGVSRNTRAIGSRPGPETVRSGSSCSLRLSAVCRPRQSGRPDPRPPGRCRSPSHSALPRAFHVRPR